METAGPHTLQMLGGQLSGEGRTLRCGGAPGAETTGGVMPFGPGFHRFLVQPVIKEVPAADAQRAGEARAAEDRADVGNLGHLRE